MSAGGRARKLQGYGFAPDVYVGHLLRGAFADKYHRRIDRSNGGSDYQRVAAVDQLPGADDKAAGFADAGALEVKKLEKRAIVPGGLQANGAGLFGNPHRRPEFIERPRLTAPVMIVGERRTGPVSDHFL